MKRRAHGEGSLLKLKGCRFYYASFYHNGRQVRISTKTDVKQKALAELRRLMGKSESGGQLIVDLKKTRYGDLRKMLLDDYMRKGNKSLLMDAAGNEFVPALKPLDQFFGWGENNPGPTLAEITSGTAALFIRERKAEGAGNAVINRSLAALRHMLNLAKEQGKIQNPPVIKLLAEPPARQGFVEQAEFERLVSLLPTTLQPLITFLYYSGCRLNEALSIEWPQVDLARGIIRLESEQTKNKEPRLIPLPPPVIMMLTKHQPKEGRVFEGTNLKREWQAACVRAGLGSFTENPKSKHDPYYEGLLIHDLRRSAVRNLRKAGVSEGVAMAISGHKSRTVFERYNIKDETDVLEAMRLVSVAAAKNGKVLKAARRNGEKLGKTGSKKPLLTA